MVTAVLFFCGSLFLMLVIQIIDVVGAFDLLVNVLREYLQFKFLVLWTGVPNLLWFELRIAYTKVLLDKRRTLMKTLSPTRRRASPRAGCIMMLRMRRNEWWWTQWMRMNE
jgi:hypothetical protein